MVVKKSEDSQWYRTRDQRGPTATVSITRTVHEELTDKPHSDVLCVKSDIVRLVALRIPCYVVAVSDTQASIISENLWLVVVREHKMAVGLLFATLNDVV